MAYVRKRGSQLAIVHGVRDPETKKVQQQILFTLYSKGEALEAIGKGRKGGDRYFRSMLEDNNPRIRLDWKCIREGIEENLDVLPDNYDHRHVRVQRDFRNDLVRFVRQMAIADPQMLAPASRLIEENRQELQFLSELIDWQLENTREDTDEWRTDTPFFWRYLTQGSEVPLGVEEIATGHYEKMEYERASAIFRLLVEGFPNYADGYNYLGLIALQQEQLDEAIVRFRKTIEVGRLLFPKRIAKDRWWSDTATRPYMRGLRNLALTLNQARQYEESLVICDRLDQECHDDFTSASHRATAFLCLGRWEQALDASLYLHRISPGESLMAAMAAFELGRREQARGLFIHGALNHPHEAGMLIGRRMPRPAAGMETEDHNAGVYLVRSIAGYLETRGRAVRRFLGAIWKETDDARSELSEVIRNWKANRDPVDRTDYDRMMEMKSFEFAEKLAAGGDGREESVQ